MSATIELTHRIDRARQMAAAMLSTQSQQRWRAVQRDLERKRALALNPLGGFRVVPNARRELREWVRL